MSDWNDIDAPDEVGQMLRALPPLPAPTRQAFSTLPRGWLQPVAVLWLLALPLTAYLLQQMFAPEAIIGGTPKPLMEDALQATPYPHWQELLNEAQHAIQIGLQLIREVLG
ncbi:MAG: hypothetical protein NZL85_06080 [Fimbriimonadales bacterium]|nr:hypothetical protein [Fimbriimonadales bacterium]